MSHRQSRHRNVCYTLNNPTLDPSAHLDFVESRLDVRYHVIGFERAPTTGTPHYQGYIEFNKAYSFTRIKQALGEAHLEARRGTPQEAADYCKKDGDTYERGEISRQGNRSDIDEAAQLTLESGPKAVAEHSPGTYVKFHRGFHALHSITQANKPREPPTVSFLYGPAGCGKTRLAYGDGVDVAKLCLARGWFDGYHGQSTAILDDLDGAASHLSLSELLNYLDRYPVLVPVKGSHEPFVATTIYVTSNKHWKQWYDWSERTSQYPALARRFHVVLAWPRFGRGPRRILAGTPAFQKFMDGPITTGVTSPDITQFDDVYYTFVEDFTDNDDDISQEI